MKTRLRERANEESLNHAIWEDRIGIIGGEICYSNLARAYMYRVNEQVVCST